MKKSCIICNQEFELQSRNQKLCSKICRSEFNKQKGKIRYYKSRSTSRKTSTCSMCQKEFEYHFRVHRRERKFCGRSCASKFYIKDGTFDGWRLRSEPKKGKYENCINPTCKNDVYLEPRFLISGKGKVCSFNCEKAYFSQLFTDSGNPFFGKKLTKEHKEKQQKTLQKNHPGITNAFSLAKRRTKSNPQIKIFEHLKDRFKSHNFQIEKRIGIK